MSVSFMSCIGQNLLEKFTFHSEPLISTANHILYYVSLFQSKLVCLSLKPPNVHQIHSYYTWVFILLSSKTDPALNRATYDFLAIFC